MRGSKMKIQVLAMIYILALLTPATSAWGGVRINKLNAVNTIADVENSAWEPEGFDRGTIVHVSKVTQAPRIDGLADDPAWKQAKSLTVPLAYGPVKEATLKAVYTEKEVFLQVTWPDPTKDDQHRPWVWNPEVGRYVEGPQVEDALLVSIVLACGWTPSLLSGYVYDFDGWHWLAARSDPIGQAVDTAGLVQDRPIPGFVKYPSRNTTPFWNLNFADNRPNILTTPWQDLKRVYQLKPVSKTVYINMKPDSRRRPPSFVEQLPAPHVTAESVKATQAPLAVVPQFKPIKLTGDAGEVAAKGRWADGRWTVEFRRSMVTPARYTTDSVIDKVTQFSIQVFDHTDRLDEASESGRLYLQFEPATGDTPEVKQ
jgi:hypothetical protein